jgi:nicotinate-nucleotide adenylyltransferase
MKKIGLLGGTFDPIHNGHLIIAEYLRVELQLDEIWFIPTQIHALKENEGISSPDIRNEMLKLAISNHENFKCLDIELTRPGVSYTIDTLELLLEKYHALNPQFYFFIGMDNVNDLPRWKNPEQILAKSQVVAFGRPGFKPSNEVKNLLSAIQFIHVPLLEISSTVIRERVSEGKSIRYLVPDSVLHYIKENQLYKSAGK